MPILPTPNTGSFGVPLPVNPRPALNPIAVTDEQLRTTTEEGGAFRESSSSVSPWSNQQSVDNSTLYLTVQTPFELWPAATLSWLGYQYVVGNQLKRVLPICHPIFNNLRCRRMLNVHGLNPRGEVPVMYNAQTPITTFPRMPIVEYDILQATLAFDNVPFKYKLDSDITEEFERYFWLRPEPAYESLFIQGGSDDTTNYLFDRSLGGDLGGKVGFPSGINIPLPVMVIRGTWYDVPINFIATGADRSYYPNIFNGVGKLNNAEFMGYPKYSLYMDPPQIIPRPEPLSAFQQNVTDFLVNVEFTWHYFYPTELGTGVTENLGHNMAPFRGDKKWYPVSINGTGAASDRLYPTYDYRLLFRKP